MGRVRVLSTVEELSEVPEIEKRREIKPRVVETGEVLPERRMRPVSTPEILDVTGETLSIWRIRAKSAVVVVSPDEVPSKNTIAVSSAPALLNVGSGSAYLRTRSQSISELPP